MMFRRFRRLAILLCAMVSTALLVAAWGFGNARADPVVRRATIALPNWPAGAAPVTAVLLSDIHIGSLAMKAERLDRIVTQVNALHPDIVLIAGDFIYGHQSIGALRFGEPMVAALARLRAPLGVVAVTGNHDHWTGLATVDSQLTRAGVTVLENQAVVRGPLAIAGIGDDYTGHADIAATSAAVRRLPGARIALTHSPDLASRLPGDLPLLLAGHTHCGQVRLFGWSPGNHPYLPRYRCGLIREDGRAIIVTAGVGISATPLRIGAPPDLWLLTLGPKARS